jgi:gamma-glutamyltranspeptidase
MLNTPRACRGMVSSPHHLASQSGLAILREGGTAIEAAVAMAATLSVVYPHMTGVGGDAFWLLAEPERKPIGIDACGAAGINVSVRLYRDALFERIPWRGALAANTVAGAVSGWQTALRVNADWGGRLSINRLLEDAVEYAENGVPVTASQAAALTQTATELAVVPGFANAFLQNPAVAREGGKLRQPALAATMRALAREGLDSFYRGRLGQKIAQDLANAGSPLLAEDIVAHQAAFTEPLSLLLRNARVYNLSAPTQGVVSLLILGCFDRLGVEQADGFDHIHGLVEASKQAFRVRDSQIGDPALTGSELRRFLSADRLDAHARNIDKRRATPWLRNPDRGDTVWFGVIDQAGRAVSAIQSLYFEFGSGIVLPQTGIIWQNRGCAFALSGPGPNVLAPRRKPFHTLNPAMARLADGRTMVYGAMGGEGQPQTQAVVFTRYALFGQSLQASVTAPRWLLGRTWGEDTTRLRIENRFEPGVIEALERAGHLIQRVEPFTAAMGHAGAVVRTADSIFEAACDPRSDGAALGW